MSTLSTREQELFDLAIASLPEWYNSDDTNPQTTVAAFAKIFGQVWDQVDLWVDQIYLKQAFGVFLDAHARDRGTRRRTGESDAALTARLSTPQDTLTIPALQQIANAILAGAGIAGTAQFSEGRNGAGAYWHANGDTLQTFWGMGKRWDGHPHDLYVILPVGTTDAALASVEESMRLFAAGGVDVLVERATSGASYQLVTVTPPGAYMGVLTTRLFTAEVRLTDTVTWKVNGISGGNSTVGTITPVTGLTANYTAPATVPFPEDVEVQAVSVLDGTIVARARVKIHV